MAVDVDEPGEDVHALGIDHPCACIGLVGTVAARDRGDAIAFDHDIDRAFGRRARALDHHRTLHDQLFERAFAIARLAIGDRLHLG